ncbi:hypothetical protein D1831_05160 [Lactiplantibacillus garii]|uniref:Uncharacterized protein n=1 Tax=Lactiplantibacillus garii TaxID=2306423 RepID=A0A3R8J8D7_9LACO|nr:hypothetical protein D1831_05160 [Lactiplantibacillus garii]
MLNSSLKQNGISKRSNAFHELARDLTESTGFTLLNLIKQAPGRERLTNYYGAGLVRMEDGLYYYVGAEQPVKFKMDKANRLKRLIAIDEKLGVPQLIFRDMVKMMVVKFVRNGQYTVIPYPFKYLNEYLRHYSRMCTK